MDQNYNRNINLYGHDAISVTEDDLEQTQKATEITMEAFLIDIEKRAYHMAAFASGSHADALDLLQDSMIKLVTNYQDRPSNEWKPLFYKILQNRIRDWHRHQKVKNLVFFWKSNTPDEENEDFPAFEHYVSQTNTPDKEFEKSEQQTAALHHLKKLSGKQQQCFLLRSWEGLSVAQTADVMGCSQGSVKTHYSRAVIKIRTLMEEENDITF
ncbi:RNA polymerase sigma factor [Pseudoalteromonas denitrificans]|jgi:RNA polymerase sigma-70 factor (ECF subfamily)|uniref:RNA polymerase sigma-70 factor, ECF subfamily n=1 Tax=Pseudoalteromonas denitrificans DSM 6059 TaxID=1123010 RepID=A0A1I1TEC5_9GAMM|nr:RNA polymerase sigma factor [Pseudoalteromonas denitrificans]SFD53840.1 RNA polymerase sigma-70 factor, ECF subfamily [Pseudoalteromonas denitrificans DSM 6059]